MEFSYNQKRERNSCAQRSVAMGQQGMVSSSQHLATLAGYRALSKGGNAVDAAVAMVSTLNVVEPHSVGIGGDAFALIYLAAENKIVGMNGSGRAPYSADLAWFHAHGMKTMPERGIVSVTVPGALHGWAQAVERYGNLELGDVLEDAIYHAEHGFPVTEVIAGEWQNMEAMLRSRAGSSETYLVHGKAPRPGQIFHNRDLAQTYRKIARQGIQSFYEGEIAKAVTEYFRRENGLLSLKDLETHTTTWVDPISTDYRGYTIYELPPNGQGATALEILNILEGFDLRALGHNSPDYLHLLIEAKKIAFSDRDYFITDPEFETIPLERLLSKEYAKECGGKIDREKAMAPPAPRFLSRGSDTVYVTAVDQERNAVSFIRSLFHLLSSVLVQRK